MPIFLSMPLDDCFAHNKGFIRPHSYCIRPKLGGGTLEGSKRIASLGTSKEETSVVLGVELSGPILSAQHRSFFCPLTGLNLPFEG